MTIQTNSNAPFPTVEEIAEVMAQDARRRGFTVERMPVVTTRVDGAWVATTADFNGVTVVSRVGADARMCSVRGGK